MPIKYNNFDIGNAYLGNDNLVAMYQGSNLVWTNGIKLKSLILPLNTNGYTSNIGSKTIINNELDISLTTSNGNIYSILLRTQANSQADVFRSILGHKYYFYLEINTPKANQNNLIYIANDSYTSYYDLVSGNNKINAIVNGADGGSFSVCLNLGNGNFSVGDIIRIKRLVIIDLTQAKLDTLTAQQFYNLITLNGTDFTNIELLGAGYEVKLGSFKSQETNSVDLGTLNWFYLAPFDFYAILPTDFKTFGALSLNGYTTISGTKTDLSNMEITSNGGNGGSIWLRNDSYSQDNNGANQLKQDLTGVKLTYELANTNNIANSKYGFVKLKDLTWYYNAESGHERFYTTCDLKRPTTPGDVANIFCEEYETVSANNLYGGGSSFKRIASYIAQNNNLQISDNRYTNATDFKNHFTDNDILICELNASLGNKLDNYTAEQVYYMFFATLGMSKMYVPYGKRFESSDNIILGTKYGIVDLGELNYYYQDTYKFFWANVSSFKGYTSKNVYCEGFTTTNEEPQYFNDKELTTAYWASPTDVCFKDLSYTDTTAFKNSLKGKYLIYELASPNGTDYNDLTAKEMYDVINDNAIEIFANGKSVGGVRSLLGKQNVGIVLTRSGSPAIVSTSNGSFEMNGVNEGKPFNVINGHKYIAITTFGDNSAKPNLYFFSINYNAIEINTTTIIDNCLCSMFTSNETSEKGRFAEYSNSQVDGTIYKPQNRVIIDLTEHNLQNLTAQEAYQYFKENNLNILDNRGEIDIGGYIKS